MTGISPRPLLSLTVLLGFLLLAGGLRAEEGPEVLRVVSQLRGPSALRVDLVLVGDGYTREQLGPKGLWEVDSLRLVKNFFEKEPFKSQRALFNVHRLAVVSADEGADDSDKVDTKDTAFDCCYGTDGVQRLLDARNETALAAAIEKAPAVDIVIVLVNDKRFGGSGGSVGEVPAPVCSNESTAFLIAIHELGHSFAGLGDEYVDPSVADTYPLPSEGDLPYPNLTLADRIDTSSRERIIETAKWGALLAKATIRERGWYEGGHYRATGVLRPAQACAMADTSGGGRFCFVCFAELTRTILSTSGRGPSGRLAMVPLDASVEVPEKIRELYTHGLLSKALKSAKRAAPAAAEELRRAITLTYETSLSRLREQAAAGEKAAVKEYRGLISKAFSKTEWAKRFKEDAKKH